MHVGLALLTLFPGRVGGSETNVRGLLSEYAAGNGPERVTVLANRHVMNAYAGYARGPVDLHHVRSYRPGDSMPTRALAMAAARVAPRRAARDVPPGLDLVHYPVTVPIPRIGAPRVVTVFDVAHHDLPASFPAAERRYRRWAYDAAAREADLVITSSAFSRDRLAAAVGADPARTEVVPLGIDHERFRPDPAADDAELELPGAFVAYPANLWPHKNHGALVDAMARVDDLHLVLSGQGYGRVDALMDRARRNGVADRVHHLGHLPARQVPGLLRRARALVFPSLYEGFGSPPLEAMACGCPVACSNRASLPEVCGDAALLFDPEDPAAIADAVVGAAGNGDLRARGLQRAARYTWRAAADAHSELYRQALAAEN